MTVPRLAAVALVLAAVTTSACSGGDGDGDATTTTTLVVTTLPEELDTAGFVAAAERVCTNPDLGGDIGDPVDATSTVEQVDEQRDRIETRLELLRELPVPAGDEQVVDQIVQAYDRVLTALDELSTAVDGDDSQSAILIATALEGLRAAADDRVTAYGITSCTL